MKKIVVIEDEESISDLLVSMINHIRPEWEIVAVLESVEDSVEWFNTHPHPDLAFMDIQLNDGICFSIFEQVDLKCKIIFTTAYNNYAIQAFDVDSVHYLLKPIKNSKLEEAIEKYELLDDKIDTNESNVYKKILNAIHSENLQYRSKILISSASAFYHIFIDDIAFFYIENSTLFAVTSNNTEHIIDYTIDKIMSQLDPNTFFRANRSTIVNIKFIQKFENYFSGKLVVLLVVPFSKKIMISRLKATAFKNWMGK